MRRFWHFQKVPVYLAGMLTAGINIWNRVFFYCLKKIKDKTRYFFSITNIIIQIKDNTIIISSCDSFSSKFFKSKFTFSKVCLENIHTNIILQQSTTIINFLISFFFCFKLNLMLYEGGPQIIFCWQKFKSPETKMVTGIFCTRRNFQQFGLAALILMSVCLLMLS